MRRAGLAARLAFATVVVYVPPATAVLCPADGVHVQVLGSGTGSLQDGRAAASFLLWIDGQARAGANFGNGTGLRLAQAGAAVADLDFVLLTQLYAAQTADLPALVERARREGRSRSLPLYGPQGNRYAPSTVTHVRDLFDGKRGAYRHLGDVLSPLGREGYKLRPHDVRPDARRLGGPRGGGNGPVTAFENGRLRAAALPFSAGIYPALAWRIDVRGKRIVFTTSVGENLDEMREFVADADLWLASTPPAGFGTSAALARSLGQTAARARVKRLYVLGELDEDLVVEITRGAGTAPTPARDLDCITP